MAYLIGMDEAGLGPNLGPLVISATIWQVPEESLQNDWYRSLRRAFCKAPGKQPFRRLAIADSKSLYRAGQGLDVLELGVLAALRLTGAVPTSWGELWAVLAHQNVPVLDLLPWHVGYQMDLPIAASLADVERLALKSHRVLQSEGVRLLQVVSAAVFPEQLNDLIEHHGSKGEALSQFSLRFLVQLLDQLEPAATLVCCDKHGGRNRYAALLQQALPDWLVEVHQEGREESIYRWGPAERRTEFRFSVQGERYLPVALASMASKYLRELAMKAFNDFWGRQVPSLRPTAGYPGDSRRFWNDIRAAQLALGIEDRILWRAR